MEAVKHYLQTTVHSPSHWRTNWDLLWDIEGYNWNEGVLPFSQPIIPFATLFFYLITIFLLQRLMKHRQAFNTNMISALHNLILTIWSLAMCVGTGYYAFKRAFVRHFFAQQLFSKLLTTKSFWNRNMDHGINLYANILVIHPTDLFILLHIGIIFQNIMNC